MLEERTFERLGGTETLRMEARVMALTNTDLAKAVAAGRFREDLFFRLNVLAIAVPPLRERRADILPLAAHFLARLGPVHGHADALAFDPAVIAFAGTVRLAGKRARIEERHRARAGFCERSRCCCPRIFRKLCAPAAPRNGPGGPLRSLEDIEREAIKATLEATHYKIGHAAEILGISRKTLLEKRKRYGLM